MTLRGRLLLALVVILLVVIVGAVLLVRTQEASLVRTLDEQLLSTRALVRPPRGSQTPLPRTGGERTPPDAPISDLFVGVVQDGQIVPLLTGQLLTDTPQIDTSTLDERANGEPFTVSGSEGASRFRVVAVQRSSDAPLSIVALPLAEIDHSIASLQRTLAATIGVILAVLLLTLWWVERLGLRPIARITKAADAIAAGDRTHRVDLTSSRTEAGRLGAAFNLMLDERDLTEQRLRQFVADASHELRTPLTSIRGYIDLYQQGGFRGLGDLDDMLRRMRHEASRMHDLVEDLLLLAKLDQRRPLRSQEVDIGQLLQDSAHDASAVQPQRPIVVRVDDTSDLTVCGDPYRLQQVVGILVTNVLVHTDGDAELRLEARTSRDGVTLGVTDTGPGLSDEIAAHVFDRFYRGEQSRSRRSGGSGLGLAIARSLVEAHGGTIRLHTAPGSGCRFVVTLPQGSDRAESPQADPGPSAAKHTVAPSR